MNLSIIAKLRYDQFDELNSCAELVDLKNRLLLKNRSSTRQKFSPAPRKFAVTLHFYSPAAYKYVRQVFNNALPHPLVIGKWSENNNANPGF